MSHFTDEETEAVCRMGDLNLREVKRAGSGGQIRTQVCGLPKLILHLTHARAHTQTRARAPGKTEKNRSNPK